MLLNAFFTPKNATAYHSQLWLLVELVEYSSPQKHKVLLTDVATQLEVCFVCIRKLIHYYPKFETRDYSCYSCLILDLPQFL